MGTCPHSTAPQRQGKKWQFWAPTARALPGCLGKLGSLEWQLQDTQPVRRLPLWTPLPLLLGLEKTQREAEETLSPKPNSSRSLLSKRLLRLPGFHNLPPRPPGTTGSFLHPTAPFLSPYVSLLPFHPEMQKPPQRPSGHQHMPVARLSLLGTRACAPRPPHTSSAELKTLFPLPCHSRPRPSASRRAAVLSHSGSSQRASST